MVIPIISKMADIHFFGHVHQPRPVAENSPGTTSFTVQGGALYEKKGVYNGYSIVDIGPDNESQRGIAPTMSTGWNSTSAPT